jgi:hypothetical protein
LVAGLCVKDILERLWAWGEEEDIDLKNELLLSRDMDEQTAWHLVASAPIDQISSLEQIWMWGAQVNVDLKEDLLLSRYHEGQTAGHLAALRGNQNILEKILAWGKEQTDVMDEILLSVDQHTGAWLPITAPEKLSTPSGSGVLQ